MSEESLFKESPRRGQRVGNLRNISWERFVTAEVVAVASVALAGLYVFLRFPFAIFFEKLGTSPEEVGLGYFQLLAQSSVFVVLVAGLAALLTSYPLLLIFNVTLAKSVFIQLRVMFSKRYPRKSWRDLPSMSDDEFQENIKQVRAAWNSVRGGGNMAGADVLARVRSRQLRRMKERTDDETRELAVLEQVPPMMVPILKRMWYRSRRSFPWLFVSWSSILIIVILPLTFSALGDRVRACNNIATMPVLGSFGGQSVEIFDKETHEERFPSRNLLLLGSDASKYVLFDCGDDATIRIPIDAFTVIHQGG